MKKNFLWKTYKYLLKESSAATSCRQLPWGNNLRGNYERGNYPRDNHLGPNCLGALFFQRQLSGGQLFLRSIARGAILLKEIGLVAVVRRGGGNSLWGSYPLGNCHGNNCPRTLRQAPEIGKFHWFSFTSEKSMLNSQQNFHWTFNHQRVTPFNLANLFLSEVCRHTSKMNNKCYLLTQKKYHPCEAALRNAHEIGIQVPPHSPILMSLLKNQKTFMYAMLVQVILAINR